MDSSMAQLMVFRTDRVGSAHYKDGFRDVTQGIQDAKTKQMRPSREDLQGEKEQGGN